MRMTQEMVGRGMDVTCVSKETFTEQQMSCIHYGSQLFHVENVHAVAFRFCRGWGPSVGGSAAPLVCLLWASPPPMVGFSLPPSVGYGFPPALPGRTPVGPGAVLVGGRPPSFVRVRNE